jgi:hypothetical protein
MAIRMSSANARRRVSLFSRPKDMITMITLTNKRSLDHRVLSHEIDRLVRLAADLRAIRDGNGPTAVDLSEAPILNNWTPEVRPAQCLVGYVADHPDIPGVGRPIITSDLWVLAEHRGWARTLSRWYLLGRRQPASGSAS